MGRTLGKVLSRLLIKLVVQMFYINKDLSYLILS